MKHLTKTLLLLTIGSGIAMTACVHAPDNHKKPPRAERLANMQAQHAALFKQADANHDGKLSSTEFAQFHILKKQTMLKSHFAHLDRNKDNAISLDELKTEHDKHAKKIRRQHKEQTDSQS